MTRLPSTDQWTESQGRTAVKGRAQGHCEGCGRFGDTQWAHRARRSQGGLWSPSNGLALCHRCHAWAHEEPNLAKGLGWELDGRADPAEAAVWIRDPFDPTRADWYLLQVENDATGGRLSIAVAVEARWTA